MIATGMDDGPDPRGDNLRDRLQGCRREGLPGVPVPELLRYLAEVAGDLDARREPHGNVNADTIRVTGGRPRLTDNPAAGLPPASPPGTFTGTPAYMAPEEWGGTRTARSDQYALACTYAELRTGRLPFPGSSLSEVMRAHLESPPDLDECSGVERRVLLRALAKDPGKRFPTCLRFAQELQRQVMSESS